MAAQLPRNRRAFRAARLAVAFLAVAALIAGGWLALDRRPLPAPARPDVSDYGVSSRAPVAPPAPSPGPPAAPAAKTDDAKRTVPTVIRGFEGVRTTQDPKTGAVELTVDPFPEEHRRREKPKSVDKPKRATVK